MRMKVLVAVAMTVLLLPAQWNLFAGAQEAPVPTGPTGPKDDVDGDKLFDDLEARLDRAPPAERISVIVSLTEQPTQERIGRVRRKVGTFKVSHQLDFIDAFAADMNRQQIRALTDHAEVARVEENSKVFALNNSAQDSFGVTEARADAGVDGDADGNPLAYSPADLVAAVIDTGIDANHLDLNGGKVLAFKDYVNARIDPYDDNGHGTHVAATIAGDGEARGDLLYKGVAPAAGLVGVKVLDSGGGGTMANVAAGIQWVIDTKATYGIEAINLSLGTSGCSSGIDSTSLAVDKAHDAGIVVAVAAGNSGSGNCTIGSPGAANKALTVGAMADAEVNGFKQAYFSSRGKTYDGRIKPDVSAPGVSITSAASGTLNGYKVLSGTSMATPFVAGLALLMRDVNSALTSQDIKDKIMATAVDWGRGGDNKAAGTTGVDVDYGAGRLDAYAAINSAGAAIVSPPLDPTHELREGSLSGTGARVDYPMNVTDLQFPIAATLIHPSINGSSVTSPDFDLYLFTPSGTQVAAAITSRRQDELGFKPTTTGTYTLRVSSYSGSGPYFVDISAGLTPPLPPVPDTTAPAAPSGLAGTAGDASVSLNWDDNAEVDVAGYRVYRKNSDGTWPSLPLASPTASSYTDTTLTNGTTYTYRVTAYDTSNNESVPSGEASAVPVRPPLVKNYRPSAYAIVSGSLYSGSVSRLYNNDSSRLEISSAKVGTTYTSEFYAYVSMAISERATLRKLTINYDGSANQSTAALTLRVYNWQTAAWETVDGPRTGVTSDRSFTWTRSTSPTDYVSATGEMRFKITGTRSSSFRTRTDWVRFQIEY
jgi:serine protease AprX